MNDVNIHTCDGNRPCTACALTAVQYAHSRAEQVVYGLAKEIVDLRLLAEELHEALLQWLAEPHGPLSVTTNSIVSAAIKSYRTYHESAVDSAQPTTTPKAGHTCITHRHLQCPACELAKATKPLLALIQECRQMLSDEYPESDERHPKNWLDAKLSAAQS